MKSNEDKRFHLNIIEEVIKRMNNSSFLIKGWALTSIGGLVTLYITKINHSWSHYILWLCVFICLIFWVNDAYYLLRERNYRCLYDKVRLLKNSKIDFNMRPNNNKIIWNLLKCMFRPIFFMSYIPVITSLSLMLFVYYKFN